MHRQREHDQRLDRVVILFLFALFLLLSPITLWWAADDSPWYAPYLVWGLLIFLTYRLQHYLKRHEL
jgi:fatty acid desaturase